MVFRKTQKDLNQLAMTDHDMIHLFEAACRGRHVFKSRDPEKI